MIIRDKQKLTLSRPTTYQIKVPGHLDESWANLVGRMTLTVESEGDGPPVSTLTGVIDQAALHGVFKKIRNLGLTIISVNPQAKGEEP